MLCFAAVNVRRGPPWSRAVVVRPLTPNLVPLPAVRFCTADREYLSLAVIIRQCRCRHNV
jgi:hypothetical protein